MTVANHEVTIRPFQAFADNMISPDSFFTLVRGASSSDVNLGWYDQAASRIWKWDFRVKIWQDPGQKQRKQKLNCQRNPKYHSCSERCLRVTQFICSAIRLKSCKCRVHLFLETSGPPEKNLFSENCPSSIDGDFHPQEKTFEQLYM